MAQTLSGVQVNSKLTATMTSTGTNILNDIRMGQNFTTSLSTTYADIFYSVKITAQGAGDVLTWNLDTHRFTSASGDSPDVIDRTGHNFGGYGGDNAGTTYAPTDVEGNTLATAASCAAILYVTDSDNNGNVTIDCSNEIFGNVILKGGTGGDTADKNNGDFNRSALFLPRADPSSVTTVITFANADDDITLTFVGKS
jgi:hypothetical protein